MMKVGADRHNPTATRGGSQPGGINRGSGGADKSPINVSVLAFSLRRRNGVKSGAKRCTRPPQRAG